jgi:hypothetical protein
LHLVGSLFEFCCSSGRFGFQSPVGTRDLSISKLVNTGPGAPAQPLLQWVLVLLGTKQLWLGFYYPPPSIVKVKTDRPTAITCYGATFTLPVPCTVDMQCFLIRALFLFCEIFPYIIKTQRISTLPVNYRYINLSHDLL